MKYKKFALLALAAGMIVGCGNSEPAAPDWSAEFKKFVKDNFYGLEVPFIGTSGDLGNFTYAIHDDYGYAEIFGGELESSEPIKAAAEFLEEKGFVDLYGPYRDDPAYAQYVSEWSYPMEYRFTVENVGPRYIRVGLIGELPEPNEGEETEEPTEPKRSFYAQVFDPYYYSWFDSYSTELVAFAFGSAGEETYYEDETFASEIVPYLGQATYSTSGEYVDYVDEAIEEVEEDGYLRLFMEDVVREELDAYAEELRDAEDAWTVFAYEEQEVEAGYLARLYKLVSPSEYFTIDVYFAEGEALFLFRLADLVPQILKDMEPALFESVEVTSYDFEYFEDEETGESGYSYLELAEDAAEPSGDAVVSAYNAYGALVDDDSLNVNEVVEFAIYSSAEAEGVLDVNDKQVVIYADSQISGILPDWSGFTYYFYWVIEVSDWPTYPAELTNEFIAASGATNIHQFFEQEDGSFMFGTEVESADEVAAVFNAIAGLDGASVLSNYEDGVGRVALNETTMAVVELISETVGEETYYGYYVTVTEIPEFPEQVIFVAEALGISRFEFVEDPATGAWVLPADETSETLWADAKAELNGAVSTLESRGVEFAEPEIYDEDDVYYGRYSASGLLDDKLVIVQSVTVGHDADYNGYYSGEIIICDPKEENPTVTAFMQAVAQFLGIEVAFNPITGAYTFGEDYPEELSFDINQMEDTLREAFPDAEFTLVIEYDYFGDPVITIDYSGYEIEAHVEDWTFDEPPYYWIYAYCELVQE